MTTLHLRPCEHLITAGKLYPAAWKQAEHFRSIRGRDVPDWPEWCFLPMAGWYSIVSSAVGAERLAHTIAGDIGRLAALGAWRMTQGIYRFDQTLYDEIKSTPITGDLPCSVLYHLPEWCTYIETPGLQFGHTALYGLFAHLEYDVNDGRHELRLLLDLEDALIPVPIHIGEWPLEEALHRMLEEASKHGPPLPDDFSMELKPHLEPIVSLVLYVCSEASDIENGERRPRKPRPVKTKAGMRIFAPDRPNIWDVGARLGAALRRAYEADAETRTDAPSGRARPRPHVRRAHWHTYLYGTNRDQPCLKWLPPIPVNVDDLGKLPSVVKEVKKNG